MSRTAIAGTTAIAQTNLNAEQKDLAMTPFNRSKKKNEAPASEYERMSALGDDPEAWQELSDEELKQLVIVKCIEYGVSQDASRIPMLFALYRHAMECLDVSERAQLLTQFSAMTEEQKGQGHMGLMMFIVAERNPGIRSSAAMSLAVLFQPEARDVLSGPKFVVAQLLREDKTEDQGAALGGILLLGDKRLLPLLEDTWSKLSDDARLGLSGNVFQGMVEFWLRCLEKGCSESVFGSVVAAIARMPAITQVPFVLDVERVLPVYNDSQNPLRLIRKISFRDYLEEIRPRLEALEAKESKPKLIPKIYEIWENPEQFQDDVAVRDLLAETGSLPSTMRKRSGRSTRKVARGQERKAMNDRPDYFESSQSAQDAMLRRIKGHFRRQLVLQNLRDGDITSLQDELLAHDIP
jgi:hypothetical protein